MKDKLLEIINHYGVMPQLKYFQSEVFELGEAIINHEWLKSERGMEHISHIREEIADVMVMLEQFRLYYDIPIEDVKEVMEYKVNRQLERIKNENN